MLIWKGSPSAKIAFIGWFGTGRGKFVSPYRFEGIEFDIVDEGGQTILLGEVVLTP